MTIIAEYTPEEIIEHAERLIAMARKVQDARATTPDPYAYFRLGELKIRIGSKYEVTPPKFKAGDPVSCDTLSPGMELVVDYVSIGAVNGNWHYVLKYAAPGGVMLGWASEEKIEHREIQEFPGY